MYELCEKEVSSADFTLENADLTYWVRLHKSWMHCPSSLLNNGDTGGAFYVFHAEHAHDYLRGDFLFCKKYLDDYNTCYRLMNGIEDADLYAFKYFYNRQKKRVKRTLRYVRPKLLERIPRVMEAFKETNLSLILQKRCLQAALSDGVWYLFPRRLEKLTTTADEFKEFLEMEGFLEMWDESELGWWYALGLWQYGPDCIQTFIKSTFKDKRSTLMWMFLGAHHWFLEKKSRREEPDHSRRGLCCSGVTYDGYERDYLTELAASISRDDRIWTMRQIIRKAPEYGVCRDLGANVFNYFVLHDLKEVDDMMCIVLEEIIGSSLQYLFEYAISVAIAEYQNTDGVYPLVLDEARKFRPKLLRKDLDLYTLLGM